MVIRQDITERKQAEKQLYQLNRSLKTLSECNQALVRARDETTLLDDICRNIVEFGGYHSTWIGLAVIDETKIVRPAAQVGFPAGYLESFEIKWSDTEQGHGPVGAAIRTRSPVITQNVLNEPVYAPWRDCAIRKGYASSISLPLIGVIDSVAKTTYVNQAMARMLGYTEEEMLGRPLFDFMSEADRQIAQSNVERRKHGIAEKHEFKLKTKSGKTVWSFKFPRFLSKICANQA